MMRPIFSHNWNYAESCNKGYPSCESPRDSAAILAVKPLACLLLPHREFDYTTDTP